MAAKKRPHPQSDSNKRARPSVPSSSVMTRSATKFASMAAVFQTTELLEKILVRLPMKDLLLSQRVCKKWRAVIESNKDLQRALFFLPEEPSIFWQTNAIEHEPFVRDHSRVCGCVERIGKREYLNIGGCRRKCFSIRFNPLMKEVDNVQTLDEHRNVVKRASALYNWLGTNFAFRMPREYAQASWRRMYASQPPMLDQSTAWYNLELESDRSIYVATRADRVALDLASPRLGPIVDVLRETGETTKAYQKVSKSTPLIVDLEMLGGITTTYDDEYYGFIFVPEVESE